MTETKASIQSILVNEYLPPYSLKEFHEHCKKCKCEELVDVVVAIYQLDYESSVHYENSIDLQVLELNTDEVIKDRKRNRSLTSKLMQLISGRRVSEQSFPREEVEVEVASESMQTKQSSQSSSKRASDPRTLEQKLVYIINTFIKPNSPKQINIPFIISQNLMKNYDSNNRGPSLFSECLEHCEMILKTSALPSFVSERKQSALKLRDLNNQTDF